MSTSSLTIDALNGGGIRNTRPVAGFAEVTGPVSAPLRLLPRIQPQYIALLTSLVGLVTIIISLIIFETRRTGQFRYLPYISDGGYGDPERMVFAFGLIWTSVLQLVIVIVLWILLNSKINFLVFRAHGLLLSHPKSAPPPPDSPVAIDPHEAKDAVLIPLASQMHGSAHEVVNLASPDLDAARAILSQLNELCVKLRKWNYQAAIVGTVACFCLGLLADITETAFLLGHLVFALGFFGLESAWMIMLILIQKKILAFCEDVSERKQPAVEPPLTFVETEPAKEIYGSIANDSATALIVSDALWTLSGGMEGDHCIQNRTRFWSDIAYAKRILKWQWILALVIVSSAIPLIICLAAFALSPWTYSSAVSPALEYIVVGGCITIACTLSPTLSELKLYIRHSTKFE